MNQFETRLSNLESSLRRWRVVTVISLSMTGLLMFAGAARQDRTTFEHIQAKSLLLTDDGGGFIEMGSNPKTGGADVLLGGVRQRAMVHVWVHETDKTTFASGVSVRESGAPMAGNSVRLAASNTGPQLILERSGRRVFDALDGEQK